MPTRDQVRALLDSGMDYEEVGLRLGVHPGLAFMIATGLPADGSDNLRPRGLPEHVALAGSSTQHLANPTKPENPTRKQHVLDWVKQRALADAQMQRAATPGPKKGGSRPPERPGKGNGKGKGKVGGTGEVGGNGRQKRHATEQAELAEDRAKEEG